MGSSPRQTSTAFLAEPGELPMVFARWLNAEVSMWHARQRHRRATRAWLKLMACDDADNHRSTRVDKNRTEGTKHQVKGATKEATGKATGDVAKQVAGNVEKNAGKVQHALGKAVDEQRKTDKKSH